jgi:aldose 1-epimerase
MSLEQNGELVTLRARDARLEIAPRDGGAFVGWSLSGRDLLRRPPDGCCDPLASGCFPLAPFSNLITGGGFSFQGSFHPLARNHPLEPEPIHGDAWLAPWEVDALRGNRALLSYAHKAAWGFPFRYRIVQDILLQARSLRIGLELTNVGSEAMPAGLGLHPYFCRAPGARLQAVHQGRWEDSHVVPDSRFVIAESFGSQSLDVCYVGWSGTAHLASAAVAVSINASPSARALVVYAPEPADFVCIEPVTHVNDGFNAAAAGVRDTGVRTLQPGESMSLDVVISAQLIGPLESSSVTHRSPLPAPARTSGCRF